MVRMSLAFGRKPAPARAFASLTIQRSLPRDSRGQVSRTEDRSGDIDPSQAPYVTGPDLCALFGVSQSAGSAKTPDIKRPLDIVQLDPRWCLPSKLADNPLVWMIEVNGIGLMLRGQLAEASLPFTADLLGDAAIRVELWGVVFGDALLAWALAEGHSRFVWRQRPGDGAGR